MTDQNIEPFLSSKSPGELLGKLYRARKQDQPKFSLQLICSRAKIKSKGYLGDVFSGRRKLNSRHAEKLANVFELTGIKRQIFFLLVRIQKHKSKDERAPLEKRLKAAQNQLISRADQLPSDSPPALVFLRVFCSLGIFARPPRRTDLYPVLADIEKSVIDRTLDHLLQLQVIREEDDRLILISREIVLNSLQSKESHIGFLRDCMNHASKQIPRWYSDTKNSYFASSLVSVTNEKYQETLPKIREFFDLVQSEIEVDSKADNLVYFNIQVFPEN